MRPTKGLNLATLALVRPFLMAFAFWAFQAGTPAVANDRISPEEITYAAFDVLELRVNDYFARKHGLPATLSDMPVRPGHGDDGATDGWHRPIAYEPQKDGSVVLRSLGGDGHRWMVQFSVIDPTDGLDGCARGATRILMTNIELLVQQCAAKHHRVPKTLNELLVDGTEYGGTDLDVTGNDAWSHPMRYSADPDGTVTITSDGKLGAKQKFVLQFNIPDVSKSATTEPASLWLILPP